MPWNREEIALKLLKDAIGEGSVRRVMVASHYSMLPLFEQYDIVSVKKTFLSDVNKGDVVVYIMDGQAHFIAHRCIQLEKKEGKLYAVTKGDNLPYLDPYLIGEDEFLGKVVRFTNRNKLIPCEHVLWRYANRLLADVSRLHAYLIRMSERFGKKPAHNTSPVLPSRLFLFISRIINTLRRILVKILIVCTAPLEN